MVILDQSVGIGVKTPACPLEVATPTFGYKQYKEIMRANTEGTDDRPYISVGLPSTNKGALFAFEKDIATARFGLHGTSSYNFKIGANGTEISGNIGFGVLYDAALFIKPIAVSHTVLKLKGIADQTASYLQVDSHDNSPVLNVLSDGTVGIGTDTPGATLHVIGGAIVDYCTQVSDLREKENFQPIENSLNRIKAIKGLFFNRIGHSERMAGLIAQDIQAILPEAVKSTGNDRLGIDYNQIIALLVNAVNEQQVIIDKHQELIDKLLRLECLFLSERPAAAVA